MNFWVVMYRFAWVVVIVAGVIAVVCVFLPKAHNYQELQKRHQDRVVHAPTAPCTNNAGELPFGKTER